MSEGKTVQVQQEHQGRIRPVLELHVGEFNGPFDLLLHLIKQLKIDIYDIPMTEITTQYMAYLDSMQALQLDIAAEYLVMAATLIEIKARLLLPIEPEQEFDDHYEGDPRQILVQQLLLYQQFQEVTVLLEAKQVDRALQFGRQAEDLSDYQEALPLQDGEISLDRLVQAMQEAMKREQLRVPLQKEIHHDPVTVEQKMEEIMMSLEQLPIGERLAFDSFYHNASRSLIITTFMAMLELVRKQRIMFYQAHHLAPIELNLRSGGELE